MAKITFINSSDYAEIEKPQPASSFIPEWYKEMKTYTADEKKPDGNGITTGTIKKCMPVFDAITAGYILSTPADIYVSIKDGAQHFEWPQFDLIQFHPVEQAPKHPAMNGHAFPKFINPWGIKTEKGYSILVTEPMHRELPFRVLPGVVDTDTYAAPINVIFSMKDPLFEGLIPQGTPFAQVIPFKREAHKMVMGNKKDSEEMKNTFHKLRTRFFDAYKIMYRQPKEYK
jgi:hypothetical protein